LDRGKNDSALIRDARRILFRMNGSGKAKRYVLRVTDKTANADGPSALAIRDGVAYSAASSHMTERAKIVPIVLAAGSSKNLGRPKALALFGERTALLIAVENCLGLERPIVVLGSEARRVLPVVPHAARVVINEKWREGQLGSLLCAMDHVPRSAAVLIYPVDHPLLEKHTVTQLVREFRKRESPEEIVMPRHIGRDGHPIILSAALRNELYGAVTAREVVYHDPERIRAFEAETSAIYDDFDTPKTYRKCLRKFESRS
jgi:CTP:molybdopterin cytidylyltransferase MocA